MPKVYKVHHDLGEGKGITLETGWMAKQASGSILASAGDTRVLVAAVCGGKKENPYGDDDFLPLTVDYREKTSAAGKFPGGFFKREGRPTIRETLISRLTDRPIRPLFPDGFTNEIQVICTVLSADQEHDPDILAMNAASAALAISEAPFLGPIGSVRVGLIGGRFIINPTHAEQTESSLDLVISGDEGGIIMVEAGSKMLSESKMLEALEFGHKAIKELVKIQKDLKTQCGKPVMEYEASPFPEEIYKQVKSKYASAMEKVFFIHAKKERSHAFDDLKKKIVTELCPTDEKGELKEGAPAVSAVKRSFSRLESELVRAFALEGKRSDGRGLSDIRPIDIQLDILPRTHGSSLFTRGETQALVTVTLGTKDDEQRVDGVVEEEYSQRFMLHYNFPSFSVGETKPNRGPGRREIGHGALAERAIEPVVPNEEAFPYTIRVVSDILESNGSSSMATVCGGILSMMSAGVQISAPVAGIAMGLVIEGKKVAILTDILGSEDKHGDMDFKVAGTEEGITALQMDLKNTGISMSVFKDALEAARVGRLYVLSVMKKAIAEPRAKLSEYAPKLARISIDPEKIGMVIGSGGKVVREIQAKTGAEVEIEDDGTIIISARDPKAVDAAKEWILGITEDLKVGALYKAKVVSIKDFGAFVAVEPGGQEGLCHISELSDGFIERVDDAVKMGEIVDIKVVAIDEMGRYRFSRKAAMKELGISSPKPAVGGATGDRPQHPAGEGGAQRPRPFFDKR